MSLIRVKKIFTDPENKKVMEINILPSKYCNFRCVFCPVGQEGIQSEDSFHFDETSDFLSSLAEQLDNEKPDTLFINSMGESFANDQLEDVISLAKKKNVEVSLYGNGYLLGDPEYARLASMCDEVTGEIKAITEDSFQKLQRPIKGSTLEKYLSNMVRFREGYDGKFRIALSIIKNVNDDSGSIEYIKKLLNKLKPDKVLLETFTDDKFAKAFGVSIDKMEMVRLMIMEGSSDLVVELS